MNKFNAKKITVDWIKFDSIQESRYYQDNQKNIKTLQPQFILQDKFKLNGLLIRPIMYIADFELNDWTIIDVKGRPDAQAKIKKKLFHYKYPTKKLKRVVKYQWQRIEYSENEKRKKQNKRLKQQKAIIE